ncbi:MAG: DUF2163 domain-containing protein [Paracoccaceae bacterium]
MRRLGEALEARLASGVTTLCRCWRIERRDGVVLGFTDHDRDLAFEGVVHRAGSGLTAGASEVATGLGLDTQTVSGALTSGAIREEDVALGRYDGAVVRQYLVDWTDVAVRAPTGVGRIGEVRRRGASFEAEVVGLAEALNRPFGRALLKTCDRRLGDGACGVDLDDPRWRGAGTVVAVAGAARLTVDGLSHASGLFALGRLVWTVGANTGVEQVVRRHERYDAAAIVETTLAAPRPVVAGDAFRVTAGCDKRAETCRGRFANLANFRGFPHLPGDDFAAGYPTDGGRHDGGSLFR